MDNRPIGMFDSGVGGLTVYKEIRKKFPNENIVYLGDTKSFPYGSKSKESIINLTKNGINFLISKNVKAVVIACGTATSQALDAVKELYGQQQNTYRRIRIFIKLVLLQQRERLGATFGKNLFWITIII